MQNASVRILRRKWAIEEAFLYGGAAAPLLTSCINLGFGASLHSSGQWMCPRDLMATVRVEERQVE